MPSRTGGPPWLGASGDNEGGMSPSTERSSALPDQPTIKPLHAPGSEDVGAGKVGDAAASPRAPRLLGAGRDRIGVTLQHGDVMAPSGEDQGRRQPGDAAPTITTRATSELSSPPRGASPESCELSTHPWLRSLSPARSHHHRSGAQAWATPCTIAGAGMSNKRSTIRPGFRPARPLCHGAVTCRRPPRYLLPSPCPHETTDVCPRCRRLRRRHRDGGSCAPFDR